MQTTEMFSMVELSENNLELGKVIFKCNMMTHVDSVTTYLFCLLQYVKQHDVLTIVFDIFFTKLITKLEKSRL